MTEHQAREFQSFLEAIGENPQPAPNSIWSAWWQWRCEHLEVEVQLYALVMNAKRRGFERYGLKALWEVLRWHFSVEKTEEFKCANAYTSRYARFLMWQHPEIDGFFHTAELRAA